MSRGRGGAAGTPLRRGRRSATRPPPRAILLIATTDLVARAAERVRDDRGAARDRVRRLLEEGLTPRRRAEEYIYIYIYII